MKKIFNITLLTLAMTFMASCEKTDIGGTATEAMAGEWQVKVNLVDADGTILAEDIQGGAFSVLTYNTNQNSADEIWFDDLGNFWTFKVKAKADINNLTFSADEAVSAAYADLDGDGIDDPYDIKVTLESGKVIVDGAKDTPTGMPADSISVVVLFEDDTPAFGARYQFTGYRRTGFE